MVVDNQNPCVDFVCSATCTVIICNPAVTDAAVNSKIYITFCLGVRKKSLWKYWI